MPRTLLALTAALIAVPAMAQLVPGVSVPPVQVPSINLPDVGGTVNGVTESVGETADRLLDLRTERVDRLLRRNRDTIELDSQGEPARRGELLLIDPSPAALGAAQAAGFTPGERAEMGSLGLTVVSVTLPRADAEIVAPSPEQLVS